MTPRSTAFARAAAALVACAALLLQPVAAATEYTWDKDVGKPAPELTAAAWIGTPVSLTDLRGNVVVIAFWNADIPC